MHYKKQIEIHALWEEVKRSMRNLPQAEYSILKEQRIKVNLDNETQVDNEKIHIQKGRNRIHPHLITTWHSYQVVTPDGENIAEGLRPYMNKRKVLLWKEIFNAWRVKPRVVEYSKHRQYLPGRIKEYLDIPSSHIRKQQNDQIQALLIRHPLEEINENFYKHMMADPSPEQDHPFDVNWKQSQQGGASDDREPA